jgi:hypothetical protein
VKRVEASRTAFSVCLTGAALLVASVPAAAAAAEQARAVMSVTAIVAPACSVATQPSAGPQPAIACSTGAAVSTMTAGRRDEQPLVEAEALLGAPHRRGRAVVFTASPVLPSAAAADEAGAELPGHGARYLTITY